MTIIGKSKLPLDATFRTFSVQIQRTIPWCIEIIARSHHSWWW